MGGGDPVVGLSQLEDLNRGSAFQSNPCVRDLNADGAERAERPKDGILRAGARHVDHEPRSVPCHGDHGDHYVLLARL